MRPVVASNGDPGIAVLLRERALCINGMNALTEANVAYLLVGIAASLL